MNFTFSNITLKFLKVEKQFQPKNAYHFCNNESYVHESDRNYLINDWVFLSNGLENLDLAEQLVLYLNLKYKCSTYHLVKG